MPGGEAIGTLCIDQKPRRLSEEQKRGLTVLAHQVVTELELRQRIAELQWEVERRRAAEVQLSHLATRDPLTGLPNRNALMDRLKQGIRLADRGRHPLGFMFLDLEWDLREALERHELTLHFQPQVSPRSGELAGVEVLVRWNHPRLGLVSPLRFIHLAEESGLIWELGRQVIDMAMAQMADWHRDGLKVPRIAINLSPFQLRPELAGLVRDAQQVHGLPPDCIELEITESALTSDGPQVLELLDTLHQLGISLAVDDFGVGYSSLALLRRLPLDTLKIDKSFIDDVVGNRQDATIVRAVLDMAHGLGLRVVAEGVESEAQRDLLQAMACDDLQGYLYSRPLPAAGFAAWMADRSALPTPV